jgi:hypothetical protein
MASKPPSFNFYPQDFLTGTMTMSNKQVGSYIRLLCLQHQQGHLSEEDMLTICGEFDKKVFAKFKQDDNGNYYNERLDFEKEKRNKFIESRMSNLSKENGLNSHMGNHMASHSENEIEKENVNKSINSIVNINSLYIDLFNSIWSIYPRKEKKQYALDCFVRLDPSPDLVQTIKTAVERAKRSKQWQDKQFIPHFSTYLNQRRWEDELPEEEMSSFDTDDFFQAALERSTKRIAERAKG